MRNKTGGDDERNELFAEKDWQAMTLTELRDLMKRKAEVLDRDTLIDNNADHVLKWLRMPIDDFKAHLEKAKQDTLKDPYPASAARKLFLRRTGAFKAIGGNYEDAIVMPEGYSGPMLATVIDWRLKELALIEFAKQKDLERLAESAPPEAQ